MTETPRDPTHPNGQELLSLIEINEEHLRPNRIHLGSSKVTYSIPEGTDPEKARLSRYESIAELAPKGTRYFTTDKSTPSRFPGELTGIAREPLHFTFRVKYYK